MEGPVRSTSRIPTDWPARLRESANCVVIEDLPTPPLPERTRTMCLMFSEDMRRWVGEMGWFDIDNKIRVPGRHGKDSALAIK